MKSFAKICGWMLFLLCAEQSFSQATYGSISPVGGVTASINQEQTFTYPTKAGASYYWSAFPSSTAIPSSAVEFTSSVTSSTVKVKFKQAMVAFVCVVRYLPGGQPAQECISFNVVNCNTLPAPTSLTGPLTVDVCLPEVTYTSSTVAGATAYEWTGLLSGNRITPTPTLVIAANEFKIGNSNRLRVRAINECGGYSAYYSKTITGVSTANPGAINGPTLVENCGNLSYTYTVPAINGAIGYVWDGFEGDAITTDTPSITLQGNVFLEGTTTLSVQVLNNCGALTTASTLAVQRNTFGAPTSVDGPALLCSVGGTYTTQAVQGAVSYKWTGLVSGEKITSTPSLSVTPSDFTLGATTTLAVSAVNACGNTSASVSMEVKYSEIPTLGAISGPTGIDFCNPGSPKFVTAAVPEATLYTWSSSLGLVSAPYSIPETTVMVDPNVPPGSSFTISVYATTHCGNTNTVTLNGNLSYAPLPTISGPSELSCNSSTFMVSNSGCGARSFQYKWYVNNTLVSTTSQLTLDGSDYPHNSNLDIRVERLFNSSLIGVANRGVRVNCLFGMSVQPNPVQQSFTVERTEEAPEEEVTVNLLRIDGTQISTTKSKSKRIEIDSDNLQPGAYLVEIIANGKREVRRVVKE